VAVATSSSRAIFFFAFTSIVANYSCCRDQPGGSSTTRKGLMLFRMFVLGMVMFGSVGELPTVWAMADVPWG
jgi:AGCS family alanine or glycine:cation symporter